VILMSWQEIVRREQKVKKTCEALAAKFFPDNEFEVKSVDGYIDLKGRSHCLVDFKKRHFEPFNCDDYCDQVSYDEEGYNQCLEDCKFNLDKNLTNSVDMLLDGTIIEATMAGDCRPVWSDEFEEWEEFEERRQKFYEKWEKAGCKVDDGWIHPHELIGGAEWEEYPATCFYHMTAKKEEECKIDKVLDIMKEVW